MDTLDQHVDGDEYVLGIGPGHHCRVVANAHFESWMRSDPLANPLDQRELASVASACRKRWGKLCGHGGVPVARFPCDSTGPAASTGV